MDMTFGKARNEAEARLMEFVINGEPNSSFVYTTSNKSQSYSLMSFARKCYEDGLVVLVQKRVGAEIHYVAIKRENDKTKAALQLHLKT